MKRVIWVISLILLLNIVIAVENKVFILDLNYDNGQISINDVITKAGYAPDRKLQPEQGYKLEITKGNEVLYSFKFEIPLKINTDVIEEKGEISGGIVILEKTNFALVVPYYKDAEHIKIYDNKDNEVVSTTVVPALGKRNSVKWIVGFAIIFVVLFFLLYERRRKKV